MITDGQLDNVLSIGSPVGASAKVALAGVEQSNVCVDSVTDSVIFNHKRGTMRFNSKGEAAHELTVNFTNKVVLIFVGYGQSNTFGFKTADRNPNDTTSSDSVNIRMMNSGKTALVTATRQIPSPETPTLDVGDSDCMLDLANYYQNYFNARGDEQCEIALILGGAGGSAITTIGDGTAVFTTFKNDLAALCSLIVAEGKVPLVCDILYTQGEKEVNTSTVPGWADRLITYIYDPMVAHIKATTGQAYDPIMQLMILSMHSNYTLNGSAFNDIALEQLRAQSLKPGEIKGTCFTGWSEHAADGIHLSGKGQRYMRQMQAKFAAYTDLRPLTIAYAKLVGGQIQLYVVGGSGNLQFDFSVHVDTTAKGMRVFNNTQSAVTISSVTLNNTNRAIIVDLADGGTNGPYTIDGSYYSNNTLGGGQYHQNIVPVTDSDTRNGVLTDSVSLGNQDLRNPLMPFKLTTVGV